MRKICGLLVVLLTLLTCSGFSALADNDLKAALDGFDYVSAVSDGKGHAILTIKQPTKDYATWGYSCTADGFYQGDEGNFDNNTTITAKIPKNTALPDGTICWITVHIWYNTSIIDSISQTKNMMVELAIKITNILETPSVKAEATGKSGEGYATWDAVEGAASYDAILSGNGKSETTTTSSTSISFTGLTDGKTYTVSVRANNSDGSPASSYGTSSFTPYAALPAPENVKAVAGENEGECVVTFDEVKGAQSYRVSHYNSETGAWVNTDTVSTQVTLDNLAAVTYEIMVKAMSFKNNPAIGDSAYSESVFFEVKTLVKPVIVAPVTLVSVTATGKSGTAEIAWSKNELAEGYAVYAKTGADGKWIEIGRTSETKLTYDKFIDNTEYSVAVRAYNKSNYSEYSNIITVKTYSKEPVALQAPKSLTAEGTGKTSKIRVAFDAVEGAGGYVIAYGGNSVAIDAAGAQEAPSGRIEYVIEGLKNGKDISIKVKATTLKLGKANSPYTDTVKAHAFKTLQTPYSLSVVSESKFSIKISFKGVANATRYLIMYKPKGGEYSSQTIKKAYMNGKVIETSLDNLESDTQYSVKVCALAPDDERFGPSEYTNVNKARTR